MQIIIKTNADFTPKGKRTAKVVTVGRGGKQLRWYVGGKLYRRFSGITSETLELSREWTSA